MQGLSDVCWDQEGKYLCTASDDFTLKLWDVRSKQCLRTLEGHTHHVFCCCFSPKDNHVVSGHSPGTAPLCTPRQSCQQQSDALWPI